MNARNGFGKRKFGDQAKGQQRVDWQYRMHQFLIGGGVNGRPQTEIVKHLINHVKAAEINAELAALLSMDKVQKFELPCMGKGRPTTVWRATVKLLESD